jgi:hypothetical protein
VTLSGKAVSVPALTLPCQQSRLDPLLTMRAALILLAAVIAGGGVAALI